MFYYYCRHLSTLSLRITGIIQKHTFAYTHSKTDKPIIPQPHCNSLAGWLLNDCNFGGLEQPTNDIYLIFSKPGYSDVGHRVIHRRSILANKKDKNKKMTTWRRQMCGSCMSQCNASFHLCLSLCISLCLSWSFSFCLQLNALTICPHNSVQSSYLP